MSSNYLLQQCSKVTGNNYNKGNKNVYEYVPLRDYILYILLFKKVFLYWLFKLMGGVLRCS